MSTAIVSIFWSVVFTAFTLGCLVAVDYIIANYGKQLGGGFDVLRVPVSWMHIGCGACVIIAMKWFKSPYGRHASNTTSASSESSSKAKAGKKKAAETTRRSGSASSTASSVDWTMLPAWVGWMVQESPTLIAFAYFAWRSNGASIRANPALLLFCAHYINRTIIFPLFLGNNSTPMRAWVSFLALTYCIFNGILQNGIDSGASAATRFDCPWLAVAGAALFVVGMYGNITTDKYLTSMKKQHAGYVIPRHAIFTTLNISCPNFFSEFVEWVGFAVCTAGCCGLYDPRTLAAASFALFTAANTFPRGVQHHQWYLSKFGAEYAALGRYAVVPGLI